MTIDGFSSCSNKLPCGYCKVLMAPCMNPDYNPPSYDPQWNDFRSGVNDL